MSKKVHLTIPCTNEELAALEIGDKVFITGVVYTGRDTAHTRMVAFLDAGNRLPFDVSGQVIYYVGPAPGSAGTTNRGCRPDNKLPDGCVCTTAYGSRIKRNDRQRASFAGSC